MISFGPFVISGSGDIAPDLVIGADFWMHSFQGQQDNFDFCNLRN
tara:strand:- start:358 stop:492 length:135 start_codon:yes stop_codon:yes gene_type:complete